MQARRPRGMRRKASLTAKIHVPAGCLFSSTWADTHEGHFPLVAHAGDAAAAAAAAATAAAAAVLHPSPTVATETASGAATGAGGEEEQEYKDADDPPPEGQGVERGGADPLDSRLGTARTRGSGTSSHAGGGGGGTGGKHQGKQRKPAGQATGSNSSRIGTPSRAAAAAAAAAPPRTHKVSIKLRRGSVSLTRSQHDLFGRITGGYTGPQDGYAKFLGPAKHFRLGTTYDFRVDRLMLQPRSATSRPPTTTGAGPPQPPPTNTTAESPWRPTRKRLTRQQAHARMREQVSKGMLTKWASLEDLRVRIISVLRALQSFQRRNLALEAEHDDLRQQLQTRHARALGHVTAILQGTEEDNRHISTIQAQDRRGLVEYKHEYHECKIQLARELEEARARVAALQERLAAQDQVLADILSFRKKEEDGLLQEEVDKLTHLMEVKRAAHQLNLDHIMAGYQRDLAQQVDKNEGRKFDVVERARQRVSAAGNEAITMAIRTQHRLHLEAQLQVQEQCDLRAHILRLERENAAWRERVAAQFDRRRLVLGGRLRQQMDCTPEAEITLSMAGQ